MVPVDYAVLTTTVEKAVQSADSFNKVWIGLGTVCVSLLALLVGAGTQMLIAMWQRRSQERVATRQVEAQKLTAVQQLKMQELTSRRSAVANIATKRQAWIDDLRKDIAIYLRSWREITYRWEAHIDKHRGMDEVPQDNLKAFIDVTSKLRMEALELAIRIQLRLNPNEAEHTTLRLKMEELEDTAHRFDHSLSESEAADLSTKVHFKIVEVTKLTQHLLKKEWERIKEESYVDPVEST